MWSLSPDLLCCSGWSAAGRGRVGEGTALPASLSPSAPSSPHLTGQPPLAAAWHTVYGRKMVMFMLDMSILPVLV